MSRFSILTAAALALTGGATAAQAADVIRCNAQVSPGVFKPVLRVSAAGSTTEIHIGERGLNRRTYFKDDALLAYVSNVLGVRTDGARQTVLSCGTGPGEGSTLPVVAPEPEPPEPEPPAPEADVDPDPVTV